MDSSHLHIFLEKMATQAYCPLCKTKVGIMNIKIQGSTDKMCIFRLHCDACNNDVLAHAVITIENKKGEPQDISILEISPEKVSEYDIFNMMTILKDKKYNNLSSFLKR